MWFLLLQIFILMLLAAALGAALMWWWLSRRHESLAVSQERLLDKVSKVEGIATRDDLSKHATSLLAAINGQKPVDLQPVESRLETVQQAVSGIRLPETDLSPVQDRIDALEARLAAFSLDPVMMRVADVGAAVAQVQPAMEAALRDMKSPEVDLGPVHASLASLGLTVNALEPRLNDLGARIEAGRRSDMDGVAQRFAGLSSTLSGMRMPDIAPLQQRLSEIQAAIANIRMPDTSPLQQRITELQAAVANIPQPNLQPLKSSLADLETFVVALDKPPQDLGPLFSRLASLDDALARVQVEMREAAPLKPIDRRLAGIEEAIGSMPGPDMSPVLGAVRSIDNRNDLVAMENRLTAIEYGLAALHHMLRSRPDVSRADAGDSRIAPPLQVVRTVDPQPAPSRPDRDADPINAFRRAGDEANLLSEPAFGPADDLEAIDGVGPMLRALLHDLGIFYFWQVAEWSGQEIDWVESKLMHFRGRIRRDDWVGHARVLAAAPNAAKRPMQPRMRGVIQ